MVFTKLSAQEKDAFFGLLDEYFQSRPELFGGGQAVSGVAGTGISPAVAVSAVQRALAAGGAATGSGGASTKSSNPYASAITAPNSADVARAVSVGRVAAASLAFSQAGGGGGLSQQQQGSHSASPSPLAQFQQVAAGLRSPPAGAGAGNEVDKLVTRKTGVLNAFAKQPLAGAGVGASVPPAFAAPKNTFGPPPVRRATSEASAPSAGKTVPSLRGPGAGPAVGTRTPQPAPPEEEVAKGEWVEVLYDYNSEEPGDLVIKAGSRVLVTDKSSDDWWTGQVEGQGREGLFPASYVKLL